MKKKCITLAVSKTHEDIHTKVGIIMNAFSTNHRGITAAISLFVYLLVITTGGLAHCICLDDSCNESHQLCCAEESTKVIKMSPDGIFPHPDILVESSCETCSSFEKSLDEHERFERSESSERKYTVSNIAVEVKSLAFDDLSRHDESPNILFSCYPGYTLRSIVLLI